MAPFNTVDKASSKLLLDFLALRDHLFGFILALTRNRDDAEEIFQEVGLAVADEANRGTKVTNFPAWAREVARRRVAEHRRKASLRGKHLRLSDSLEETVDLAFSEAQPDPEEDREKQAFLESCLEELGGRTREVIERRYRDLQSIPQIASGIGWTEGSVKVALSRGRKSLAACVESKWSEE